MATIKPSMTVIPGGKGRLYQWVLASGDDGEPIEAVEFADRSVQVAGTFGGGAVVIEGSNDSSAYATLTDPQGNDLSIVSAKVEMVTEVTRLIRPRVSGGAGASLTVSLLARFTA
jgi:hypothetical protein